MSQKNRLWLLMLVSWIFNVAAEFKKVSLESDLQPKREFGYQSGRIVDYPFAVFLPSYSNFSCSGVLVDTMWIMTLYDCFKENYISVSNEVIIANGNDGSVDYRGYYTIKWIYDHPLALAGDAAYRFVLLELTRRMSLDGKYQQLNLLEHLPSFDEPANGRLETVMTRKANCSIIGLNGFDRLSKRIQILKIDVNLYPWEKCQAFYSMFPQLHVCALSDTFEAPEKCFSHIGALLVCDGKVFGIQTPLNHSCGISSSKPTLFLRVDHTEGFRKMIIDGCVGVDDCFMSRHSKTFYM